MVMADHRADKVHDSFGNPGALHQGSRQDKKGNCQQGKGIQPGKKPLRHQSGRHIHAQDGDRGGKPQGDRHRNGQEKENKHYDKHYNDHTFAASLS